MSHDIESAVEVIVVPRTHDLGDGFNVRRALPSRERRMVGPFVFFDEMGPHTFSAGQGLDVRPHPHIGLSTVTYLLQGEIQHRDSLGTSQSIRPGEVNWMTAGKGIVHSERTAAEQRAHPSPLFGLQCWVALPKSHEENDPSFLHFGAPELPVIEGDGASARIISGSFLGRASPVPVASPMFYVDLRLEPGARLTMPAEYPERAVYVLDGTLDLGRDGRFARGQLVVLKPGAAVTLGADGASGARLMLLGGEPMDGPRHIWWNFVSSSKEDWKRARFDIVPGDEKEFIPLPSA